jgi:hypothetical protein
MNRQDPTTFHQVFRLGSIFQRLSAYISRFHAALVEGAIFISAQPLPALDALRHQRHALTAFSIAVVCDFSAQA